MASYFDTSAVDCVVEMCRRLNKPYAFLFNAYDDRKIFAEVNQEARDGLAGRGTVLKGRFSYHPKYRIGQSSGKAGPERTSSSAPRSMPCGPRSWRLLALFRRLSRLSR